LANVVVECEGLSFPMARVIIQQPQQP